VTSPKEMLWQYEVRRRLRWLLPPAPVWHNPAENRVDAPLGRWNLYIGSAGAHAPGYVNLDLFPLANVDVLPALPEDVPAVSVRTLGDRYVAVQGEGDVVLSFHQTYAEGWSLDGLPDGATAEHITVNGWANGWVIRGLDGRAAVLSLHYRWEWLVAVAVWSVVAVWLVALACTDWRRLFGRRTPR